MAVPRSATSVPRDTGRETTALGIFATSYGEGNPRLASFRAPGETFVDSEGAARSRGNNVLYLGSERNHPLRAVFGTFPSTGVTRCSRWSATRKMIASPRPRFGTASDT